MASEKVTIEMTVAEAKAVSSILNVTKAFQNMGKAMQGMGMAGGDAGDKLAKGADGAYGTINRAVKAFLSLSMGMRAFHLAVSEVNAEVEKFKRWRGKEAEQEMGYGAIKARIGMLIPKTGPQADMTLEQIDKAIQAGRGTATLEQVGAMTETAVSGGAMLPVSERVKTALALAPYLESFDPSSAAVAGRAAIMLRETYGVSPEGAAGTFISAMGVSNITDPTEVAKNLINPALQLKEIGFNLQDAVSTMVEMQIMSKDVSGASSRTAVIQNVLEQVMKVNKEKGLQGQEAIDYIRASGKFAGNKEAQEFNKKLLGGYLNAKALDDARYAASSNLDEKDEIKARAGVKIGVIKFFQPDPGAGGPQANEMFGGAYAERKAVRETLATGEEAARQIREEKRAQDASPAMRAYRAGRIFGSLDQGLALDKAEAVRAQTDKLVEDLGAKLGSPSWAKDKITKIAQTYRKTGSVAEELFIQTELLKEGQKRIRERTLDTGGAVWGQRKKIEYMPYGDLNESQRTKFDEIARALEKLVELAEAARKEEGIPTPVVIEADNRPPQPPTAPSEPNIN